MFFSRYFNKSYRNLYFIFKFKSFNLKMLIVKNLKFNKVYFCTLNKALFYNFNFYKFKSIIFLKDLKQELI